MTKRFEATLHREGTKLVFRVHDQPEEWRCCHGEDWPRFHASNGVFVDSILYPEVIEHAIFLRGTETDCDHNVAERQCASVADATAAFARYDKALSEFVDAAQDAALGAGISLVSRVEHRRGDDGTWSLAKYTLQPL